MIRSGIDALRTSQIDVLAVDATYRRGTEERRVKAVVGVYEIATGGAAVAIGAVVSVDPATGKVVAAGASGAVKFGHAVTAATASDATVNVRLAQGLA